MRISIHPDPAALALRAASHGAAAIRSAIAASGVARVIAASAASQIRFLAELVKDASIDWTRVELYQLDDYLGLSATHPASFRHFLQQHLIGPTGIPLVHQISGELDPASALDAACRALHSAPIDLAFVGIGENGHLAFNDPPADFTSEAPYLIVELDRACRLQQVGEGWFRTLDEVPHRAISMSIRQILKAKEIVAVVPDLRKAPAVRDCLEGPIVPEAPASILRTHANASLYLDRDSASLLRNPPPHL